MALHSTSMPCLRCTQSPAEIERPTMDDSDAPSKLAIGATHLLPTTPPSSKGDKPRKVHSLQYVSDPAPISKPDDTAFLLIRLRDTLAWRVHPILPLMRVSCVKHITHSWSQSPYFGMTCLCVNDTASLVTATHISEELCPRADAA